ncbi:MAG: CPBP family intramembrane metalloprotease [Phycisphaeraceae bacterium]|nr:CPBP family intramembrane metalloprotease [Phycisphaeraceae bacterium]
MNQQTPSVLGKLDAWMQEHPWHPRLLPYVLYVVLLALIGMATAYQPALYPVLYWLQCAVVAWLLWRYRKLTPELNCQFHWLAIPVGILVCVIWIGLGQWMMQTFPDRFKPSLDDKPHLFATMSPMMRWTSLSLRVLGMSLLVPMFEELFVRSLLLRSFHRFRGVVIGLVQWGQDLPLIGEWLMHTSIAKRADQHEHPFASMFNQTALGALSITGITLSTLIFTLGHGMRDWPAAVICGVFYCLLLRVTRHKGLGPVIWAHGITNALLWGYCVYYSDWQFL